MRRIILIPHGSDPNLKVRGFELAKALSDRPDQEVYCIEFDRNFSERRLDILSFAFRNLFRKISYRREGKLTVVKIPYLFLPLHPYTIGLVRWFATFAVRKVIATIRPTHIINESHFCVSVQRNPSYQLIYDLVDDHLPGSLEGWFGGEISAFTLKQLATADRIWTISHTLIRKLEQRGYTDVKYVPNGTTLAPFQQVTSQEIATVRSTLSAPDTFLIGYIGNHASWSGVDLIFAIAPHVPAHWKLVVIGGGTEIERLRPECPKNVLLTGPIPREKIVAYFSAIDVGILPFIKNDLTDAALQLKIIEYGAAKKITVAQSLSELEVLRLPHVFFPKERTIEDWIASLEASRTTSWDDSWDAVIRAYDWSTIAAQIHWD